MKVIKIEIQNIISFLQILTECFNGQSDFLLKNYSILDKENKINNDNKKKLDEFFYLLKKQDKLFMTILFCNKDTQKIFFLYIFTYF